MSTLSRFGRVGILLAAITLFAFASVHAQGLDRPVVWAGCEVYQSVVAPNSFKPNGNFDELYTGGNGFANGIPLISDAAPGDTHYNGGRWHLNVLKSSVDPDKYANACTVEDLDLNDFESTDTYFECPLQPRRGRN